jgi:selenide,water dikinase
LVGLNPPDDAGVYRLQDGLAILNTVDFFPPVVDDPYLFGEIAAANALSDVYAMGGKPLIALNIVAFPEELPLGVLETIIEGGMNKLKEAECLLVGGHSIRDNEVKYGLAVTGTVHPEKIIRKKGARTGDLLVLTKPIGSGIVTTAIRNGAIKEADCHDVLEKMRELNKRASQLMLSLAPHAVTDITGYGLIGHTVEIAEASKVTIHLNAEDIPMFQSAFDVLGKGVSGGLKVNRDTYRPKVSFATNVTEEVKEILFDPQTSGGLLIALSPGKAEKFLLLFNEGSPSQAKIIGRVEKNSSYRVVVESGN